MAYLGQHSGAQIDRAVSLVNRALDTVNQLKNKAYIINTSDSATTPHWNPLIGEPKFNCVITETDELMYYPIVQFWNIVSENEGQMQLKPVTLDYSWDKGSNYWTFTLLSNADIKVLMVVSSGSGIALN